MTTKQILEQQKKAFCMQKIKPGFITSKLGLGEKRAGPHCKYNTTCSKWMD